MGRTYEEWFNQQPKELRDKVRAGDEGNKPLLNQINWIWVSNLRDASNQEVNHVIFRFFYFFSYYFSITLL